MRDEKEERPVCTRCERPSTRDCLFGRCYKPVKGPATIPDLRPLLGESGDGK